MLEKDYKVFFFFFIKYITSVFFYTDGMSQMLKA